MRRCITRRVFRVQRLRDSIFSLTLFSRRSERHCILQLPFCGYSTVPGLVTFDWRTIRLYFPPKDENCYITCVKCQKCNKRGLISPVWNIKRFRDIKRDFSSNVQFGFFPRHSFSTSLLFVGAMLQFCCEYRLLLQKKKNESKIRAAELCCCLGPDKHLHHYFTACKKKKKVSNQKKYIFWTYFCWISVIC